MILTVVQSRREGEWIDIEVPDESTVQYFKSVLSVRMFNEPPQENVQYILEAKFPEGNWFTLPDAKQLTETRLREGNFVRLQKAFSTTESEAPVYGRRLLFQNQNLG
ncbi:hypothetical protein ACFQ3J_09725 [Paenibacillus provencensis]|uniref:Uncharacterized protein n=1 Tax=Paenibacillus provencensis TaxID=441151 RepID=A0ABW3PUQ5_9BACL|nr:hypothetical protein [Paenibacillus sp. MER 78]MCM3128834.1 hypothetical protein [Paenibacillus sp. MER 78]